MVVAVFAGLLHQGFIVHDEGLPEETFRREIPPGQERRSTWL
jgi:hypothetical protein